MHGEAVVIKNYCLPSFLLEEGGGRKPGGGCVLQGPTEAGYSNNAVLQGNCWSHPETEVAEFLR